MLIFSKIIFPTLDVTANSFQPFGTFKNIPSKPSGPHPSQLQAGALGALGTPLEHVHTTALIVIRNKSKMNMIYMDLQSSDSHQYIPKHNAMMKMQMHLELFSYIAQAATSTWPKPASAVAFGCLEQSARPMAPGKRFGKGKLLAKKSWKRVPALQNAPLYQLLDCIILHLPPFPRTRLLNKYFTVTF